MKPSLQLRATQQLSLTPQLKQAIKLLTLPAMELVEEIRALAETNPLLEVESAEALDDGAAEATSETTAGSDREDDLAGADAPVAAEADELDVELDRTAWDDPSYGRDEESDEEFCRDAGRGPSLREHLGWQIELSAFSPRDRRIALAIVDALDPDGYLREEPSALARAAALPDLGVEELEIVRHRIQRFDPLGVASRSLAECLSVQIEAQSGPSADLARRLVGEHLEAIARGDRTRLAQRLGCTAAELAAAVALIRSLDPKPGRRYDAEPVEYVVPDVYVVARGGGFEVSLNPVGNVQLRLNAHYRDLLQRAHRSAAQYLRAQMQEARWLMKSLEQRHDTVLRVARAIVDRQQEFFRHGPERMRPLVLREVAADVGLHESTVSRVTVRKYMHTPRGVYEFKHFFCSHVATAAGGEASAVAIQALIKRLIDAESKSLPLSDQALAEALKAQGFLVARRTVAKYRELMGIAASTERARAG